MAKRVTKPTTSAKQTAATRRTKKTTTPTKKAPAKTPVKKTATPTPLVTNGKKTTTKTAKTPTKTATTKKRTVRSGKNPTVKTTLAAAARAKKVNEKPITGAQAAVKDPTPRKGPKRYFYVLPETASSDEFTVMGDRIKNGEAMWSHYAIEGDVGYHHYEKLK
jgi:hypothetical protein